MKQKAKHSALQELANMMLPSLLEDVGTKSAMKASMPEEVKKAVNYENDDDDYDEDYEDKKKKKKPKMVSLSLTRLMSVQGKPESKPRDNKLLKAIKKKSK